MGNDIGMLDPRILHMEEDKSESNSDSMQLLCTWDIENNKESDFIFVINKNTCEEIKIPKCFKEIARSLKLANIVCAALNESGA